MQETGSETSSGYDHLDFPPDIVDLIKAFPLGYRETPYSKDMFLGYIPPLEFAKELAEFYFVWVGWMYAFLSVHFGVTLIYFGLGN